MAMVNLPAARRHHRSRIGYAFGLLALVGAVTALVVVVRYPAESATRLAEPVPAPEITVVEGGDAPPPDPGSASQDRALPADDLYGRATGDDPLAGPGRNAPGSTTPQQGTGGGSALADPRHPSGGPQTVAQSLFYSGLLGLAISLAGLGLVGTKRRMW
ncbi:hypothetical protein [Micromonospora sp. NPDC092111]|uniref:hypothetical protein n=1 Tax=Micromonospora sp. NPDC092111 TaxID=3364289 RepID=UPI0038298FF3